VLDFTLDTISACSSIGTNQPTEPNKMTKENSTEEVPVADPNPEGGRPKTPEGYPEFKPKHLEIENVDHLKARRQKLWEMGLTDQQFLGVMNLFEEAAIARFKHEDDFYVTYRKENSEYDNELRYGVLALKEIIENKLERLKIIENKLNTDLYKWPKIHSKGNQILLSPVG